MGQAEGECGVSKKTVTLLQRILESREQNRPLMEWSRQSIEEAEVVVAWLQGKVDSAEACKALGINSTSQIHQKCGTVLRNLCKDRYITITWNQPIGMDEPADADSREAEA
jgi:predicted PP-loop superfamily ATPase